MLLRRAKNQTVDISQSLKKLEENERREIRIFDSIAKVLSRDFPELLKFILDGYQVEAEKTRALVGKEFVFIKRIADVIFSALDKKGNEVIINRNIPFLLPFLVEYELISLDSTTKTTDHILSLRQQIDTHEEALTKMIETLTPEKMDRLRTTVEYLWGKSYSNEVFNQSTLLKLMRERLN